MLIHPYLAYRSERVADVGSTLGVDLQSAAQGPNVQIYRLI